MTFAKITTISTRISGTEIPSMPSSERVATRMSPNAKIADEDHRDEADDQPVDVAGAEPSRNACPNSPTSPPTRS